MLTPSLPLLGRASPNASHCLSRTLRGARLRDKPGGLVVDYLGLADQLKKALITYTESGGQGNPTFDTAQAIAVMLEKHGIACDLMHGFNWDKWTSGKTTDRLALIPAGQEHILEQDYEGRADGPSSAVRWRRLEDQAPYPPDLQEDAVKTVLAQAELLCAEWV